jgi:hypothetical protein
MTKTAKKPAKKQNRIVSVGRRVTQPVTARTKSLLARRPHRSFRMTKRRDYKRSFKLPGYWSFTGFVWMTVWKNWRLFGGVALTLVVVTLAVSGISAQQSYSNLSDALKQSSGDLFKGQFGSIGEAGLLLLTTVTTGLSPTGTSQTQTALQDQTALQGAQSVVGGLAVFFGWLVTVWLLRNVLAGHKPRLRDGLYNSGAPVLATVLVGFVIVLQLLPAAIAAIIYSAAANSGLMDTGVSAMLVWCSVIVLCLISLYWITSSFIALVVVTLPGMYPMQAIKTAGDLVIGRRVRTLLRLIWLTFVVILAWLIVMIPIILFDDWIKNLVTAISWLPIVPLFIIAMGAVTLVYVTSYIYLLYRRIVDDDAAPA